MGRKVHGAEMALGVGEFAGGCCRLQRKDGQKDKDKSRGQTRKRRKTNKNNEKKESLFLGKQRDKSDGWRTFLCFPSAKVYRESLDCHITCLSGRVGLPRLVYRSISGRLGVRCEQLGTQKAAQ